jgi:hypothetical protein
MIDVSRWLNYDGLDASRGLEPVSADLLDVGVWNVGEDAVD